MVLTVTSSFNSESHQSYSWYFSASSNVTADDYTEFDNATELSDFRWKVVNVAYARYVLQIDRAAWENEFYNITEMTDQEKRQFRAKGAPMARPAAIRPAYLPYQYFAVQNSPWNGYDLLSADEDRALMEAAMESGKLVFDVPRFYGFRGVTKVKFALPWYGQGQNDSTGTFQGMFTGSMDLGALFNISVIGEAKNVASIQGLHKSPVGDIPVQAAGRTYIVACKGDLPSSLVPYIFIVVSILLWIGVSVICGNILMRFLRARAYAQQASERIGLLRTNAEALYKSISDPIFSFDTQGYIVDANGDALQITGYCKEDLEKGNMHIGSVFRHLRLRTDEENGVSIKIDMGRRESKGSIYPSADSSHSHPSLSRSFFSGDEIKVGLQDVQVVRKDGVVLDAEANFSTSKLESHMVQVVVFRDVTERRAAERQLHEAKETAEKVMQEKTSFLTFICHQLRSKLAPASVAERVLELVLNIPVLTTRFHQIHFMQ
ncbi:hypothetical protein HDV00_004939 [Rhizophlyctis rosea]|nr:hypothetical protein HDV00_004939 [Rhizophlyctis rosea]